jgi:hypothetical protein
MKKFNINGYMYIQITDKGWEHLRKTVGDEYIKACIKSNGYNVKINDETWYKMQCWNVFDLLPISIGGNLLFNTNVMFDDEAFDE